MNPEYYDNEKSFVYIVEDDEANKVNVSLTIIKSMPVDTEVSLFKFHKIGRIVRLGNSFIF